MRVVKVRARRSAQQGFTLFELLISITLLGLLLAMLFGGVRFGNRAWETANERIEQASEIRVVQGFLRQQLSRAMILEDADDQGFVGRSDRLQFPAPLPEQFGLGRVYLLTLSGASEDGKESLVLGRQLAGAGDAGTANPSDAGRSVLLPRIDQLELAYFGIRQRDEPADWSGTWDQRGVLPQLVRIRVRFPPGDRRVWPDLVVAPMVNAIPEIF
ncbi:MAG: prepilin-type N-terminal cleavage/methylation domain-containing protein [Alphaproteobacteria bacterium]|nr:prepilin-type N-terminal cleavage/methylation domain-containing protein [Alphaproteobacteria bacterium]